MRRARSVCHGLLPCPVSLLVIVDLARLLHRLSGHVEDDVYDSEPASPRSVKLRGSAQAHESDTSTATTTITAKANRPARTLTAAFHDRVHSNDEDDRPSRTLTQAFHDRVYTDDVDNEDSPREDRKIDQILELVTQLVESHEELAMRAQHTDSVLQKMSIPNMIEM